MPDRVLPIEWLPPGRRVYRVLVHWTAGGNEPSAVDREHYHFLIDGDGEAHRGERGPGRYLAHTKRLNTGSIGLALCGMAGAKPVPFRPGLYPIKEVQWERAAQAAAEIVHAYKLALTERTVLQHAEVTPVYGIKQVGKWDINVLPWKPGMPPVEVWSEFRRKVSWFRDRLG